MRSRNFGRRAAKKGETSVDPILHRLETERLKAVGISKLKEAEVLEGKAETDTEVRVAARARRAEAKEYFAEVRRRTGADEFLHGFGLSGSAE